jgi:crotonobetainyl-CoA:carnitine CoA-transferase CaiB-like acyl-CoA transferase
MSPLAGISIVETYAADAPLALRLAGGLAGRIAADLGARVVKVEHEADPVRHVAPLVGDTSTTFAFLNAGKTIARDAAQPLARADAVITDAAAWQSTDGLGPIAAVLSMFRHDAAHVPASEFGIMALGGLLDMVGDPQREPLKLGGHQAAYAAGLAAYTGLAAALCRPREAAGFPAETIHVSMLDTLVWLNWKSVPSRATAKPLTRTGAAAEWQVVRCADGFVALVYQEPDWAALCDIVDDARLRAPLFLDRVERIRRSAEIVLIVEEKFLTLTRREIHALALARRIPLGPIWSPRELASDPQTTSRHFLAAITLGGRKAMIPRLPVIWTGAMFMPGEVPLTAKAAVA